MQNVGAAFASPQPPDTREVADAIATLVEAPQGARPERVSVDRFVLGAAVDRINAVAKPVNDELLETLGLGAVVS